MDNLIRINGKNVNLQIQSSMFNSETLSGDIYFTEPFANKCIYVGLTDYDGGQAVLHSMSVGGISKDKFTFFTTKNVGSVYYIAIGY